MLNTRTKCSLMEHLMGEKEESMLRIRLVGTDDPSKVFPSSTVRVPDYLKHLELESFGISEIVTFIRHDHQELSNSQRLFLLRIQDVVLYRLDPSNRLELYVRDLVDTVIKECKLDDGVADGIDLYAKFSRLLLTVASKVYTLLSDKECRRSDGIVWILQHSKQRFDTRYKQGDIQMVVSMLAASQDNFAKNHGKLGRKVYGIKVVGEEFFFYSISFEEEYLQQIADEWPSIDLVAYKYPRMRGLRISKQAERKEILCLLHKVREGSFSNVQF